MNSHIKRIGFGFAGNLTAYIRVLAVFMLCAITPVMLDGQSRILFGEAQMVGSWESVSNEIRPYSMHPHEAMQRPSVGFDLLQRFGSQDRDWGYLAIQARLTWDDHRSSHLEAQLYNAYLNFKGPFFDTWVGHNKPALGLSSTLDNHAVLLMDNTMSGLVLDRDWGVGLNLDRQTPELKLSFTTGSGLSLYQDESWLLAGRMALGRFNQDNISLGASLATGNVFKTMGYNIMHNKVPHELLLGGVDFSKRIMEWELRSEALYGSFHNDLAYTSLARLTWYPLTEDRMGISLQGQFQEIKASAVQNYSAGVDYRITPDLSIRTVYNLQQPTDSHVVALQLYYLKALPF